MVEVTTQREFEVQFTRTEATHFSTVIKASSKEEAIRLIIEQYEHDTSSLDEQDVDITMDITDIEDMEGED